MYRGTAMNFDQSQFRQRLNEAWSLRFNQQIEQCMSAFSNLKSELVWSNFERERPRLNEIIALIGTESLVNFLSLEASLLRARRQFSESAQFLNKIESNLSYSALQSNYHFMFEKGLTHFLSSNYQEAMNYFMIATEVAISEAESQFARMNLILCMENLGIPYENNKNILLQKSNMLSTNEAKGLRAQLEALSLREKIRSGHLHEVSVMEESDLQNLSQVTYLRLWVKSLPYHANFSHLKSVFESFATSSRGLFNKTYRLRTLQAHLHEEDFSQVKLNDILGRLYLWTWNWLCNPDSFPIQKITELLFKSRLVEKIPGLTEDDRRQLANILRWLSLFDPLSQSLVQAFVKRIYPALSDSPNIYDYESLFLSYLSAIQSGQSNLAQDYRLQIEQHPLSANKNIRFAELLSPNPAHLKSLCRSLLPLLQPSKAVQADATNTVDLLRFEIKIANGAVIRSLPLALALEILSTKNSVSVDEFLNHCFGIPEFDGVIHMAKINNLLARVKELFGRTFVQVKAGRILVDQKNAHSLVILNSSLAGVTLRHDFFWRDFLNNVRDFNRAISTDVQKAALKPTTEQMMASFSRPVKRYDFEKRFGISRATAQRLIYGWLRGGLLKRKGHGKNTLYLSAQVNLTRECFQ
jgi:hypothetical protein